MGGHCEHDLITSCLDAGMAGMVRRFARGLKAKALKYTIEPELSGNAMAGFDSAVDVYSHNCPVDVICRCSYEETTVRNLSFSEFWCYYSGGSRSCEQWQEKICGKVRSLPRAYTFANGLAAIRKGN